MEVQIKMENEKGKIGIGNKEAMKLKPRKVKILGYRIEMQKDRNKTKDIGEKVIFIVRHPEKESNIEISSVSYEKLDEINTVGTWFKLDEDGKIMKGSALASMLTFIDASNLDDTVGKEMETKADDKGYLVLKAY